MNSPRRGRFTACSLTNLAALCCVVAGCTQSPTFAPDPAPQDRVEMTLVDRAEFDAVLARLRGKVVLVDCWATWCGPCVEQLPHSVALAHKHAAAGLALLTVDFDDPDAAESVRQALAKAGAGAGGITNLQTRLGSSSESMDVFEIASGALPHYKLFDHQGKLRQTFELDPSAKAQFTPADIEAAVVKLLAE